MIVDTKTNGNKNQLASINLPGGFFPRFFFPGGIFLRVFSGWYFSEGFISGRLYSGGYNRGNKLMVHLLEYRPIPLSFNVRLGLLAVGVGSKLNPLNIEVRGKTGGQSGCSIIFFPDCIFSGGFIS